MPSQRYLLVEGVAGHPVSAPQTKLGNGSQARYVGMSLDGCVPDDKSGRCSTHPDADHVLDHYVVTREVVLDQPDMRTAIKHQELTLLAQGVFKNFDLAREKLHARHGNAAPTEALSASPTAPATGA